MQGNLFILGNKNKVDILHQIPLEYTKKESV